MLSVCILRHCRHILHSDTLSIVRMAPEQDMQCLSLTRLVLWEHSCVLCLQHDKQYALLELHAHHWLNSWGVCSCLILLALVKHAHISCSLRTHASFQLPANHMSGGHPNYAYIQCAWQTWQTSNVGWTPGEGHGHHSLACMYSDENLSKVCLPRQMAVADLNAYP